MATKVNGSFYVQLQPERGYWDKDKIEGLKAVRVTQKKPAVALADAIVVKFNVSIDDEAFEQLPVANIDIPLNEVTKVEASVSA